jgi:hypothetical protein
MPTSTPDQKVVLQGGIKSDVETYNKKRSQILKKAYEEGGPEAVASLEDEYVALCNADFELTRHELQVNHPKYAELLGNATVCTKTLQSSMDKLDTTVKVLDCMSKLVNVIGRILILLSL